MGLTNVYAPLRPATEKEMQSGFREKKAPPKLQQHNPTHKGYHKGCSGKPGVGYTTIKARNKKGTLKTFIWWGPI
jgi:hypothetical protein